MIEQEGIRRILQVVLGCALPDDDMLVNRENLDAWDSLKHIQVVLALEEAYGIQIPEDDMVGLDSLSAISLYIKRHGAA
jgi:acyl carrier protein